MKNTHVYCFFILFVSSGLIFPQLDTSCPEGMIAYWKLDEFGGVNKFADSFGGNFAFTTDTSRPSEDSGVVKRAREFDGESEIMVPENNIFDWSAHTSFTIELWVKIPQSQPHTNVFIGKSFDNSKSNWFVAYEGNNTIFSVSDSGGVSTQMEGEVIITDGKWHFITAVRNDSSQILQLYVDGEQDAIESTFFKGDFKNAGPITIGYFNNSFNFEGSLDEIALYNRALTKSEITLHYNNGLMGKSYCDITPTDVKITNTNTSRFILNQNYPNPFNPSTTISYHLPAASKVEITIYDILGNEVKAFFIPDQNPGIQKIIWNGRNNNGKEVSSGVYLYHFKAIPLERKKEAFEKTSKLVLMR